MRPKLSHVAAGGRACGVPRVRRDVTRLCPGLGNERYHDGEPVDDARQPFHDDAAEQCGAATGNRPSRRLSEHGRLR